MFYVKLATTNLKKNKQAYVPFLLSMVFLVVINVVMQIMLKNKGMSALPGAEAAKQLFSFGSVVILIFTVIFSLYTNSFLLKQRKKELGLYNILGMGKKELAKILFIETLFASLISIVTGIVTGIIFSKLAFLILKKMTGFGDKFEYSIDMSGIMMITVFFLGMFFIMYVVNMIQLKMVNPLELLKGEQHGEKEPKAKWITGLIGLISLGAGYWISLTIQSPVAAITLFFIAVLLVIVGTYALFTSSSIMILKLLKRNKSYYYQPNHFISVSSMMYRMKQNAVGLASICILSTMVLVTVATTASLYFGMDNVINNRNPYELSVTVSQDADKLSGKMTELASKHHLQVDETNTITMTESMMILKKKEAYIALSKDNFNMNDMSNSESLNFMTQKEYQRLTGDAQPVAENQAIVYSMSKPFKDKTFQLGGLPLTVIKTIDTLDFIPKVEGLSNLYLVVLRSTEDINRVVQELYPDDFEHYQTMQSTVYMNMTGSEEEKLAVAEELKTHMIDSGQSFQLSSQAVDRKDSKGFMGGFLFLGLIFGVTFTLATGIIIYYKQISEGIQDEQRYHIMQRVGMSHEEVKRSIRGQVLMVFFFPIALASLHLAFAFPIITKMLVLFGLSDWKLFLLASVIVVAVFLLIYLLIFNLTSKAYYRIVERKV